jgi:glutathione S-transferase
MTELFKKMAEKSGQIDSSRYGASGDMKKTQYVLELIGSPTDADTLKCIITAAEQGMEMNCYSTITDAVDNMNESIKEISPFSITPCLKEADFITCGGSAITSFIDARGLGYALTPRNATLAAMQEYWVEIAVTNVAPHVDLMVDEAITKKMNDSSYSPDMQVINACGEDLKVFFDALDKQLETNKYIVCDKYTWADLHWTVYCHLCEVAGCSALINERKNVKDWFKRIKSRKSQCGQDMVAYDMLPNAEETQHGRLRSVEISNY